jgi:hypothetical protein
MRGHIDGVTVKRGATDLEISVPASAGALVYGASGDGKKKAVIDFANSVAGISNTLTSLAGYTNSIVLGNVLDYAVNKIGHDFSGIGALRGKYQVTVVIDGVPLCKADGSALPMLTLKVPTLMDSSGAVVATKSVSGSGLIGFITLADRAAQARASGADRGVAAGQAGRSADRRGAGRTARHPAHCDARVGFGQR